MKFESIRPVLTDSELALAAELISANPGSLITSVGPQWISLDAAREQLRGCAAAFTLCGAAGAAPAIGVGLVAAGAAPGHLRIRFGCADDDAMVAHGVTGYLDEIVAYLCSTAECRRIDIVFGAYNGALLRYFLSHNLFRCEGIMRERYFAAGQYWDGLIWSLTGADIVRLADGLPDAGSPAEDYSALSDRVSRRIRADLAPDGSAEPR